MLLLEFQRVREKLAAHTTFPLAKELALGLMPSYEPGNVARRQEGTTEARRFLRANYTLDMSEARDLRHALDRAALGGVLTGEELRDVRETLKAARGVRLSLRGQKDMPILGAIVQGLPVLRELEKELGGAIGRSGEVLDSASPMLKDLRAEAQTAYRLLQDSLERTVRRVQRHNVLQEPIITQRNGRMVLLVKTEMKHRVPGIVHDVSDSGATFCVEPMAVIGLGNRWREMRLAEEHEEERVLRDLSAKVEAQIDDLICGLERLAQLDLAMAKARYSVAIDATAPTVFEGERQYIRLIDARHPLVEGEVVPITVSLGDRWLGLLITGPNAGGKTVALKTIGLLTLMSQAGLHIPAAEGTLSLFDGVYADIGDQQSIQRSLSTSSSHIQNLEAIMEQASERSLVLVDELGTSTDPEEGAALAKAILLRFLGRRISLVATTHQRDVAAFVQDHPELMNASVELDPRTLAPTYRLTLGLPGRSYALTIASRLGLRKEIIDDARSLLPQAQQRAEGLLSELQEERHLAHERHREAEEALAQAERKSAELEEQLATVRDRQAELVEEARHQLQQRVDEITKRLRAVERDLDKATTRPMVEEVRLDKPMPPPMVEEARKEVAEVRKELSAPEWRTPPSRRGDWLKGLQAGDRVYLRGIPTPVEVITPPVDGATVEVLLGTMRARLPAYQLDRPARELGMLSQEGIYYSRPVKAKVGTELDLHGTRVEQALEILEGFLNDATVAGFPSVRIMHGVGTGALRNAVREYLRNHPLVKSIGRDEDILSDGVTIVELA